MRKCPIKACFNPPPGTPGGVGVSKKSERLIEAIPWRITSKIIKKSQKIPHSAHKPVMVRMPVLVSFLNFKTLSLIFHEPSK
jgi:hypothetical protein